MHFLDERVDVDRGVNRVAPIAATTNVLCFWMYVVAAPGLVAIVESTLVLLLIVFGPRQHLGCRCDEGKKSLINWGRRKNLRTRVEWGLRVFEDRGVSH